MSKINFNWPKWWLDFTQSPQTFQVKKQRNSSEFLVAPKCLVMYFHHCRFNLVVKRNKYGYELVHFSNIQEDLSLNIPMLSLQSRQWEQHFYYNQNISVCNHTSSINLYSLPTFIKIPIHQKIILKNTLNIVESKITISQVMMTIFPGGKKI